jgi:hypothetical protein
MPKSKETQSVDHDDEELSPAEASALARRVIKAMLQLAPQPHSKLRDRADKSRGRPTPRKRENPG